jgi:nicotinate-nucleotide--dimethylbenzimidazole phosphoribosyltransferase
MAEINFKRVEFLSDIKQATDAIIPASEAAKTATREYLNRIAKPLGSLGRLEDILVKLGGVGALKEDCNPCVVVMCADNGVVAESVSQTGSDVTAKVASNMTKGKSSVCLMAKSAGVPVFPYDIGMVTDVDGVTSIKTMYGTNDFYNEPAMTYETAQKAVLSGINTAIEMYNRGYDMIATGEMGIGNTTTSSAVTAVFTGSRAEDVTGRGAGLSDEALARKIHVIEHGIKKLNPNKNDVIDVISKVGGLDIAGMAGLFIGGAYLKIPVIIDGFISGVAALTATRLAPACADYMIASHMSKEPGASKVYEMLLMKPLMSMGMALGEGTGAVTVIPLIKMAVSVYFGMPTFDKLDMEAYVDYDKK